jgi:hypothetical protein
MHIRMRSAPGTQVKLFLIAEEFNVFKCSFDPYIGKWSTSKVEMDAMLKLEVIFFILESLRLIIQALL